MKKPIYFLVLFLSSVSISYSSTSMVNLINAINSGQTYCPKNTPENSQSYLKQISPKVIPYCDNGETQGFKSEFSKLKEKAIKDPKKYAYYISFAYDLGIGVDMDTQKSWSWMQKAITSGDQKAKYGEVLLKMQGASKKCNVNLSNCISIVKNKLKKIDTAESNELLMAMSKSLNEKCKYGKQAYLKGSPQTYPLVLACDNKNHSNLTSDEKKKLKETLKNPNSSIATKESAQKILGDEYHYNLLKEVLDGQ